MNFKSRSVLLLGALALSACDSHSTQPIANGQVSLPIPPAIRQAAALESNKLEIQISVNDSAPRVVPVSDTDNTITEVVNVPVDQVNEIAIAWYAIVESKKLLLASITKVVTPDTNELNVSNYTSDGIGYDEDGDGRSNLDEAIDNRNLLSEFDLSVPLRNTFGGVYANVTGDGLDTDFSGDPVEPDTETRFSLRHDGTNMVVYVCGGDKTLQQGDGDGRNEDGVFAYWHDDAVFVYLDGDNSDRESYDTVDDFQLAFIRQTGEMIVSKGINNQYCPNAECITHRFFPEVINNACEYELEVFLPIAELNITIGAPVGFDIELTDDDNGGLRDSAAAWIGYNDASNEEPRTFGTIILE